MKVLGFPVRDILFVDGRLILEEQLKLRLRHGVTFNGDFEAVRWFNGKLGSRINWPFDVVVLALVDSWHKVEVALAMLFLSVR